MQGQRRDQAERLRKFAFKVGRVLQGSQNEFLVILKAVVKLIVTTRGGISFNGLQRESSMLR
jgi:hypothetical protein